MKNCAGIRHGVFDRQNYAPTRILVARQGSGTYGGLPGCFANGWWRLADPMARRLVRWPLCLCLQQ